MFCYTGGFSVYAMRGNAKHWYIPVDSSAKAIDLTNKNIELNFPGDNRHAAYAEDAFKYLTAWATNTTLSFWTRRHLPSTAMPCATPARLSELNVKAFEKIKPGGILSLSPVRRPSAREFPHCHTVFTAAAAMSGPQRAHPAPVDAARRPPGKHLPP